jgi:PKD repeat protein
MGGGNLPESSASHGGMSKRVTSVALAVVMLSTLSTAWMTDSDNAAPQDLGFSYAPSDPNTGTKVNFSGFATDPEGDPLTFTWDFGDGCTDSGQFVSHQFMNGSSNVTMYVDDGQTGPEPRPVSITMLVIVTPNSPPTVSVPDHFWVCVRLPYSFSVNYSDNDSGDQHRFTWFWGDDQCSVTTVPTAIHTYTVKGTLVYAVYCDDLTGLLGHNVSDTGLNTIGPCAFKAPTIGSFTANVSFTVTGSPVNFSALATDADTEVLGYTFDFGDGAYAYFNESQGTIVSVTHAYASVGVYDAWVAVTDYNSEPVIAGPNTIDVAQGNSPPVVDRPSPGDFYGTMGSPIGFHAWANDSDGNTLTFWWDFGDGTFEAGAVVSHTFTDVTGASGVPYRVWVNDNNGSNISSLQCIAVINAVPDLSDLPLMKAGAGESTIYTAYASDLDTSDALTYSWSFGDGSDPVTGNPVSHIYETAPANYTITVTVDDGYVDDFGVSHVAAKSTTVAVAPFVLHLISGWNFVTIPPILNGYRASNIGLLTGDSVCDFNPTMKRYRSYVVGGPPPTDFVIAGSTGYWIHTSSAETLYLYGTIPTTPQSRTIILPPSGGWFIVGFNSLNTTMKASNIPAMYSGGSIVAVTGYTVPGYHPCTYVWGLPPSDFALVPGRAYWCYATASGTLSYMP